MHASGILHIYIENIDHSFIAFDVVELYPSISIDLLSAALDFASHYHNITDDERYIILHAKKSLLYDSGESWGKKASSNLFDVTMGSYDGAETCELVGAFLLHNIRDDGLGISNASPRHRLVRSSTSMALRSQLNPTKKSRISLT